MTEPLITLVDINRASLDELVTIQGIGHKLAERIIANRPYGDIHDLVRVSGINETRLLTLLPFITIGTKKTRSITPKPAAQPKTERSAPMAKFGDTETFVFLEDHNERQDALLIIFAGFILGLIFLMLRRKGR